MNIHDFADKCPPVHYLLGTRIHIGRELHRHKRKVLVMAGKTTKLLHERDVFATKNDAIAEALYRSGQQRDRANANIDALTSTNDIAEYHEVLAELRN